MHNSYRTKQTKGFTIVELLVIIAVIAILAAITIVSYSAVTENAKKQRVQTDAQTLYAALNKYKSERGGFPAEGDVASVITETKIDPSTVQYSYNSTAGTFCFTVSATGVSVNLSSGNATPKDGGCPGHGVNGAVAVTNLVKNPRPNSSYWFSSSASVGTVSYVGSGATAAARSTRITTAAYALYSNRTDPVATAQEGDVYTIIFTISSPVTTTVTSQIGYGASTSVIGTLSSPVSLAAGVPQTIKRTITIPAGYDGQPIFNKFLWSVGAAGEYFDVSQVMWVKGDYGGSYADGSTAGWVWNGAADAATSTGPGV